MAVKELLTRIALKYDSYNAWTTAPGKDLVLLKGEIGICEIPTANADSHVAPTVLFKVGNGEATFENLPWASAKAADVYGWAKSETVVLDGTSIKFKTGDKVNHTIDLSSFATDDELAAVTARVAAIEGSIGEGGDVADQLADHAARLGVIEGEAEGSIKKAVADAVTEVKAYADQAETDAVAAAKEYADAEFVKDRARLTDLEAAKADHASKISANTTAIADEATARADAISAMDEAYKAADKAINDKIGEVTGTIGEAIADAKKAGTDANAAVEALAAGAVATNAADIAQLRTDLEQDVADEAAARIAADEALDARLDKVETFFKLEDGETLDTALDTLVEIQDYLNGEGEATGGLISRVAANEEAIEALEGTVGDANGGLVKDAADAKAAISAVEGRATALETLTAGFDGTIKAAVEAAQAQADKGVEDAGKAQAAADKAQGEIDALELVVGDAATGLAATKAIADQNKADLAALTGRVSTAEGEIDALQAIVSEGDNTNAKLREDITALQAITGDASKGNEKLRADLDAIVGVVNHADTGLAKTKEIADGAAAKAAENAGKIADIEADYLKAADEYVFNCGTSTTITHVVSK